MAITIQQLIDAQKTIEYGRNPGDPHTIINPATGKREPAVPGYYHGDYAPADGDENGLFIPNGLASDIAKSFTGRAHFQDSALIPGLKSMIGTRDPGIATNTMSPDQSMFSAENLEGLAIPAMFAGGHLLTGGAFGGASLGGAGGGAAATGAGAYVPEAAILQQSVPGALEAASGLPTGSFLPTVAAPPSGAPPPTTGGGSDPGFQIGEAAGGGLGNLPYGAAGTATAGLEFGAAAGAAAGAAGGVGTAAASPAVSWLAQQLGMDVGAVDALTKAFPALLGAWGAMEQGDAQKELFNQFSSYGAPSRARYEASFAPDFDPLSMAGYKGAIDTSTDAILRKLSAQGGNPWGNPGALAEAQKWVLDSTALPALQNYRNQNAATGGFGAFSSAAPAAAAGASQTDANILNALGSGFSNVFNPQPTLADLVKAFSVKSAP